MSAPKFEADLAKHHPVVLNQAAVAHAHKLGLARWEGSMQRGDGDTHGSKYAGRPELQLAMNIQGAFGEVAFCVFKGLPLPTSVNTYKSEPDVPAYNAEIRGLSQLHYGLLVRPSPSDTPGRNYVLVIVPEHDRHICTVVGWLPYELAASRAAGGGQLDLGGRGAPAWWIPQRDLFPIELLQIVDREPLKTPLTHKDISWNTPPLLCGAEKVSVCGSATLTCTRRAGHDGLHAVDYLGAFVVRWEQ